MDRVEEPRENKAPFVWALPLPAPALAPASLEK